MTKKCDDTQRIPSKSAVCKGAVRNWVQCRQYRWDATDTMIRLNELTCRCTNSIGTNCLNWIGTSLRRIRILFNIRRNYAVDRRLQLQIGLGSIFNIHRNYRYARISIGLGSIFNVCRNYARISIGLGSVFNIRRNYAVDRFLQLQIGQHWSHRSGSSQETCVFTGNQPHQSFWTR
jgi:hypothetical protein